MTLDHQLMEMDKSKKSEPNNIVDERKRITTSRTHMRLMVEEKKKKIEKVKKKINTEQYSSNGRAATDDGSRRG